VWESISPLKIAEIVEKYSWGSVMRDLLPAISLWRKYLHKQKN
jgi:hypothetical protein